MTATSAIERHACIVEAALLTCHALKRFGSFRARDLKLYIELFFNWLDASNKPSEQPISNTHLARYIKVELANGILKQTKSKDKQLYVITTNGLTKIIKSIVSRNYVNSPEHCFFVLLFVTKYLQPYLKQQANVRGSQTRQLAAQLLDLASPGLYIEAQLHFVSQKKAVIEAQHANYRHLESIMPDIDIEASSVADLIQYLEGNSLYFMHQYVAVSKFFKENDLMWLKNEIKNGPKWRSGFLSQTALSRLELLKEQLLYCKKGIEIEQDN